jgi:hypothetical protein
MTKVVARYADGSALTGEDGKVTGSPPGTVTFLESPGPTDGRPDARGPVLRHHGSVLRGGLPHGPGYCGTVPRIIVTEHPTKDAARYLRHWSVPEFVEKDLAENHPGLSGERRRAKAKQVAFCIAQALEYLESTTASSMLTKPLPLFYAAENLAKAACISRDPSLAAADFAHHGLKKDDAKRNSMKNLRCSVHQNPSRDVWTHLVQSCNADMLRITGTVDGQTGARDERLKLPTQPFSGRTILLGDLLRHLPELVDDVVAADWGHSYVVPLNDWVQSWQTGPPATEDCRFILRHGHHADVRAMIVDRERDVLKQYGRTRDVMDIIEYHGTCTPPPGLTVPRMKMNVFGELFMDLRRTSMVFGELCLYFAALFILSSLVRYDAEQWKRLIDDHPAEAILVDRFLDIAVRKLPNLVLNELEQQAVLFKFAR